MTKISCNDEKMIGVIKNIFEDNWPIFEELNRGNIRRIVYKEIMKMLKCGSLDIAYIEFKCEVCEEIKRVGFRCKSRFCTSCEKKKLEDWADDMVARLIRTKYIYGIYDKQRQKNKIRKTKKLVKDFFEEKKKETITYKCLVCGEEVEVPRLSIEMRIEKDEFGELDIPGYACKACDATRKHLYTSKA